MGAGAVRGADLAAAERGHAVLTSDEGDIGRVNPELILVRV
jgi:hypothetical protein